MALHSAVFIFLYIVASNGKHTYKFKAFTTSFILNPLSGTTDTVYFRLCNINNICGMFTRVDGGWPGAGNEFNHDYITNQYLGAITKVQIVLEGSNQLCVSGIEVDGNEYDPGVFSACIEDTTGGCDTITVNLHNNIWNEEHTLPCEFAGILDDTYHPTKPPTTDPTPTPTSQPTDPTKTPTISPTYTTGTPTNNPTTLPTIEPTNMPSITPTTSPTEISQSPSVTPTKHPSASPTAAPFRSANVDETQPGTTDPGSNGAAKIEENGKINMSQLSLIIGIACGSLFILTVVLFVLYCCHIRRKQRQHVMELKQASELAIGHDDDHPVQLVSSSPASAGEISHDQQNDTNSSQVHCLQ